MYIMQALWYYIVASELKDPICHSDECQIGSFSSEATICAQVELYSLVYIENNEACMNADNNYCSIEHEIKDGTQRWTVASVYNLDPILYQRLANMP